MTEEDRSQDESSLDLRTLNINELKRQKTNQSETLKNELNPGGDQISMNLLYT